MCPPFVKLQFLNCHLKTGIVRIELLSRILWPNKFLIVVILVHCVSRHPFKDVELISQINFWL